MKCAYWLPSLVAGILVASIFAQNTPPVPTQLLQKHMLDGDYPELFSQPYRTRVENILFADVDNDGAQEFVVHFSPHYRQSATLIVYKLSPDSKVTRVAEGLAPGPVQAVSGEYMDSHELGSGVDFSLGNKQDAVKVEDPAFTAWWRFGGLVAYHRFFHADGRKGPTYFVDMTGVELPGQATNCASFEFSKVRQIAAGHLLEDSTRNYLAAWVGDEIYIYLIEGVSSRGLLRKKTWVVKAPAGFSGFLPGQGLAYRGESGTSVLTIRHKAPGNLE